MSRLIRIRSASANCSALDQPSVSLNTATGIGTRQRRIVGTVAINVPVPRCCNKPARRSGTNHLTKSSGRQKTAWHRAQCPAMRSRRRRPRISFDDLCIDAHSPVASGRRTSDCDTTSRPSTPTMAHCDFFFRIDLAICRAHSRAKVPQVFTRRPAPSRNTGTNECSYSCEIITTTDRFIVREHRRGAGTPQHRASS